MKIFSSDTFVLPLPPKHRFPMAKYARLRERVEEHALGEVLIPPAARDSELLLVHCPRYLHRVRRGELDAHDVRRIGFPWSPGLVERSRRSVGATIAAARAALEDGFGVNLAGGTHHAFRDRGGGYCVFNDIAVAIRVLQQEGRIRRASIIDLDVHQGDGTAALFRGDEDVFTLSFHGARNYPLRKQTSDLDVPLPDGCADEEYLALLPEALERALAHGPDLVFYLAGADPYERDRLGNLSLTREGLLRRDRLVLRTCAGRGLPVALSMGGGYAREVDEIVTCHLQTVREASQLAARRREQRRPEVLPRKRA